MIYSRYSRWFCNIKLMMVWVFFLFFLISCEEKKQERSENLLDVLDFNLIDQTKDQTDDQQFDQQNITIDQSLLDQSFEDDGLDQSLSIDLDLIIDQNITEMPTINVFYGDITISSRRNLEIFNQNAYTHIEGTLKIANLEEYDSILNFEHLVEISGNLEISNNVGLFGLQMNQLHSVEGSISIREHEYLNHIQLSSLEKVGGDFSIKLDAYHNQLREIQVPNVREITNELRIEDANKIQSLDFSKLTIIRQIMLFNLNSVDMIDFSSLINMEGSFTINSDVRDLRIDQLEEVENFFLAGFLGTELNIYLRKVNEFSFAASIDLESFTLPFLEEVNSIVLYAHLSLISISIPNLTQIPEKLSLDNMRALQNIHLPNVTTIGEIVLLYLRILPTFEIPQLTSITKSFSCTNNEALTTINLPNLRTINLNEEEYNLGILISELPMLQNIQMNSLVQINGSLSISNLDQLQYLEIPNLQSTGNFYLSDTLALVGISLPILNYVKDLILKENQSLTTFELANLNLIGNDFEVRFNPSLINISMPSLTRIENSVSIQSNPQLNQLYLPELNFVGRNYINVQFINECHAPLLLEFCQ